MISNRLQHTKPSATLAINAKAIEMKKRGIDVIKFGTGEPDFDTPDNIKAMVKKAIDEGFTKYTATDGISELKEAICNKLSRDNGIAAKPENVIVSNGGKQALYNCFMALLNPGDEVILPSPYWVSYADMIELAEGVVKTVDTTGNRFKLTAEMVKNAIGPKTKAIVLNSPGNPTGAVIDRKEIEAIAKLTLEHDFFVISDEVYECFNYTGEPSFSIASIPEMKDRVFTINAVSKTYAMTGWRIGYLAGPAEFVKGMATLQGHMTSNPCSIAQKAALEALNGSQDSVKAMAAEYRKRRDFVFETMNRIPGFKLDLPEGAFYAFPDVSACYKETILDSVSFSQFLLEKARVAVIPGIAFGQEGDRFIRLSYASSMKDLEEGLERIRKAVGE